MPTPLKRWIDKANRSLFFFIALLFHLVLFLIIATWVIFQAPVPPKEDFQEVFVPARLAAAAAAADHAADGGRPRPTAVPTTSTAITTANAVASFTVPMPQIDTTIDPTMQKQVIKALPPQANNLIQRLALHPHHGDLLARGRQHPQRRWRRPTMWWQNSPSTWPSIPTPAPTGAAITISSIPQLPTPPPPGACPTSSTKSRNGAAKISKARPSRPSRSTTRPWSAARPPLFSSPATRIFT